MLPMLSVALPELVNVIVCATAEVPTGVLANTSAEGVRVTTAPRPLPLRLMTCGDPAASSPITMVPLRVPDVVGVKVTENVQLPAAGTLFPQLSVSAKSPLVVIDEIESDALPMFRSRTVCGWLLEPIV